MKLSSLCFQGLLWWKNTLHLCGVFLVAFVQVSQVSPRCLCSLVSPLSLLISTLDKGKLMKKKKMWAIRKTLDMQKIKNKVKSVELAYPLQTHFWVVMLDAKGMNTPSQSKQPGPWRFSVSPFLCSASLISSFVLFLLLYPLCSPLVSLDIHDSFWVQPPCSPSLCLFLSSSSLCLLSLIGSLCL